MKFGSDDDEEEDDEPEKELPCNYDGCDEVLGSHQERLAHSMEEHWENLNPGDYPNMTGRESTSIFG